MGKENVPLIAFNRGIISKLALARIDIKRTALSAEIQTNWMPRVLGSMMLRPGLGYIDGVKDDDKAFHIPFIYASDDYAVLEFTDQIMRVRVDEEIVTRVSVSTAISNGDFGSATNWTDIDDSGATSTISGGELSLVGTRYAAAGRRQQVTVAGGDQNKEHALRIVVTKGKVLFRCGSTSGGDDYVSETTLGIGTHSLAFTPTGDFYIQFTNTTEYAAKVDSCTIEAAGALTLPTPWVEADLGLLRYDQSADVIYIACKGYQQRKIERRADRSWSIVLYAPDTGPFRLPNVSTLRLTPSALSGDITLTASRAFFKSTQEGSLFRITSQGQNTDNDLTGEGQFTDYVRISGTGSARVFTLISTGTWSGNLRLQRSVGEPGNWVNVGNANTSNFNYNYNDGLDNQIVYYRYGFPTGDYTSGSVNVTLSYSSGGITGIVRVTGYTSETQVSAEVIRALGATTASEDWREGSWSARRGYPGALALYEGRLWHAGKGKVFGSVSDAYEDFDIDIEGDSAPINRSIGSGPVDNINWILALSRLALGAEGAEWFARSSSLDEPLTESAFGIKDPSTQGSAAVAAVKVDASGLFVQKSGTLLYRLDNADDPSAYGEYGPARNMMELCPEVGQPSIVRIAVQRQPDTRIHCVRSDGKVAVLVSQPIEDVMCFVLVETDGEVEDAFVLPGLVEDQVYYVVKRTIDGQTKRYLEKWAMESECQGGTLNKQLDSYVLYDGVSTATITGLDHLEGETVHVWGDGAYIGSFTVDSGAIAMGAGNEVEEAVIGLRYFAPFKSAKLAYAGDLGTALTQPKRVQNLGLIMANTHKDGLYYGPRLVSDGAGGYEIGEGYLSALPGVEGGAVIDEDYIWEDYDFPAIEFPGGFDPDARLCLLAVAPKPCTVLAAVVGMKTNDKG